MRTSTHSMLLVAALATVTPGAASFEFDASYQLPPTDRGEFVHALCVMGATDAKAYAFLDEEHTVEANVEYTLADQKFGDGIKVWDNRDYVTKGVKDETMCLGGLFLRPALHKKVDEHIRVVLEAEPAQGSKVTVCAFVESHPGKQRDGQWDVELPRNGFDESESFQWDEGKAHETFKSYCKEVDGHEKFKFAPLHKAYSGGRICAQGTGDPHMTTFDNYKYDCQGDGDFIMSKALDAGHDFRYQARFEKVPGKPVTTTQGAAIKTGYAEEPIVEVSYTKRCELSYHINGVEVDLETDPTTGHLKLEFYAQGTDRYFIFESGVSLKVHMRSWRDDCLLNTYLCIPPALAQKNIVGIFGSPDNQKDNDFMLTDGSVPPQPSGRQDINEFCSNTWCVPTLADSLFMTPRPTCSDEFDPLLDAAIEGAPEEIKEACADSLACIVDTMAADGDITEGRKALEEEQDPQEPPTPEERAANPAPPKQVVVVEAAPEPEPQPEPEPEPETRTEEEPTPAQKGSGSGDPHFKTWTGVKFDYHGECDLVLVDNPSFHNGLGLQVHIRTTQVKYFSFIEKVAVQIGNDVLEFDNDIENFFINGRPVEENKQHHKTTLGGFFVRRDKKALSIRLQDEGTKEGRQAGRVAKIDLHTRKNGFPAIIVDGGMTDVFKGSLGMLGEFGTGRTLARDGTTEIEIDAENAEAFALEWQVRDTDPNLFVYGRYPRFPQVCTAPKKMLLTRLGMAGKMEEAKEACAHWKHDVEDCIFDVLATKDILVAEEGHIVHVE